MKPTVPAILRTLKASLEQHVIPELESHYARSQAGQIALTLEWLAKGWVEPLQTLQEGNAAIRASLAQINSEIEKLSLRDIKDESPLHRVRVKLVDMLNASVANTIEAYEADRESLLKLLDELVIAAGPPVGKHQALGPLWMKLLNALEQLALAESRYGPIPLPEEHWERHQETQDHPVK